MNLQKELEKSIKDVKSLGYELLPIRKISYMKAYKTYGLCITNIKEQTCEIKISKRLNEKDAINTIYHEVCHAIVGSEGHDRLWKKAARELNKKHGLNIKVTNIHALYNEDGKELEDKDIYKYKIKCDNCGAEQKYIRKSKAIKNPEQYRCALCGGEFHSYTIEGSLIA